MIAQIARRTFSSRSAIRAPPAPSSIALSINQTSATSSASIGRVAMLPKGISEAPAASGVRTAATVPAAADNDLLQVGSVSSQGDATKVSRIGEEL